MAPVPKGDAVRFGVVIPTFNEAEFVAATIASLDQQVDSSGHPYGADRLEVVVADTPGDDATADVAREAAEQHAKLALTVVTVPEPSMVAARIAGIEHLLARPSGAPDALISSDADTEFPSTWLAGVDAMLGEGHRMVSTAGCFEHEFWQRCPTLARRYVEHVGTLFFNADTARDVTTRGDMPAFTPELFHRFGRPVSDCGLAITPDLYRRLGGIRREYYDDEQTQPILAVGWALMFRAELAGETIGFMPWPEYETSARRLLHEPEALFSGASYLNEIEHFRSATDDQYAWLKRFADRLDMQPLQRYVVKNYVLQQCILRPQRIMASREYFGDQAADLVNTIAGWHARHADPASRDIFAFADQLADAYGDTVLKQARQLAKAGKEQR